MSNKNLVIGYIFDSNGNYDKKYYFENTPSNISDFILCNYTKTVTITDGADELIVTATYGLIDVCPDQRYLRDELLPVILAKQMDEEPVNEIEFIEVELGNMMQTVTIK